MSPKILIAKVVEMADAARKGGFLALEEMEINNSFMQKGIDLLVDGHDADVVRAALQKDIALTDERHDFGSSVFRAFGDVAPAMGMIGTLVGLVAMLSNMDDPKAIGPAMAVALLDDTCTVRSCRTWYFSQSPISFPFAANKKN